MAPPPAVLSPLDTAMTATPSGLVSPHRMAPRSRTQSISSDRPSTIGTNFMSPPLSVSPEAAFIAASAGAQIVTNDLDSHADAWYDQHGVEPSSETALVSPAALQLVNKFLDQLLFNFLSISRATTLSALRPAVSEALKPKLAKDAINQADEELREYLGGGDDEDALQAQEPSSPADWDLELVWKRTRLRCMVYSSLGDMEEEDEDFYMEQEHLDAGLGDRLSDVVSPAVAIFLTSILEFMGEQALIVAGQAAYHRMRTKYEKALKEGARSPVDVADRVVVEELDMERVALDRTLGRLWRAWKKKIRSPQIGAGLDHTLSRSFSRDSMRGAHLRSPSVSAEAAVPATVLEPAPGQEPRPVEDAQDEELLDECELAAQIPLPISPSDVNGMEVPSFVSYGDEDDQNDYDDEDVLPARPKSMMIFPSTANGLATPTVSQPNTPVLATRARSNSLPTPATTPHRSPPKKATVEIAYAEGGNEEVAGEPVSGEMPAEEIAEQEGLPATHTDADIETPGLPSSAVDEVEITPATTAAIVVLGGGLDTVAEATTLETDHDMSGEEEGDDVDEFVEEPQILTSSRISISGRSASPTTSDHGKPLTINPSPFQPARSPSVHSLRLIEVSSPRSPVSRSRGSSVDATEHIRVGNLSRTNSVRTPPIVEEQRSPDNASRVSNTSHGVSWGAPPANDVISEAEEVTVVDEAPVSRTIPEEARRASPMPELQSSPRYDPMTMSSQPIFGSTTRRSSSPASPAKPPTKVTILSSSTSSGTFFIQDPPDHPPKPVRHARAPVPAPIAVSTPPPPVVPERSPSRQALASMPPPATKPTSIGIVSVDRSRSGSPQETSSVRPQDQQNTGTRPPHTSGSSSTSSTRLKAIRTSEESGHVQADVVRNFEELIQSDQTIQYTLTPESMRDMDAQSSRSIVSASAGVAAKSRKSEDIRPNGDRSRSSSVNNRPQNDLNRSTSVSRSTGLHSHPINDARGAGDKQPVASVPRSMAAVPLKPRASIPQARDARLPRESLAEFADFIRSTGPAGASVSPAVRATGPRATGPSAVRSASGPVAVNNSIESGRVSMASSSSHRARLQARDAAVDYKDDNSDLIDFIRRGPPSATGNPRIPRTVAPFRTTMDSDQMSGAVGGKAVDAQIRDIDIRSSQASTNLTESSTNSQSALLGKPHPLAPVNNRFGGVDEDMPIPKRKTRRVRDPYAIDLSDEEDLGDDEPVVKPFRRAPAQEESLADFLRNYAPPPEPPTQPFSMPNQPKKKASAPSLMSRFGRRESGHAGSSGSMSPRSPKSPTKAVVDARSLNSRAGGGRGYIPIQVNMPTSADKYGPAAGYGSLGPAGSAVPGNMAHGGGSTSGRRVPMKKFEARDAVSGPSRGISDLAEFLKNSEPPPSMAVSNQYAPPADDVNGLSKVFSRRKKSIVT